MKGRILLTLLMLTVLDGCVNTRPAHLRNQRARIKDADRNVLECRTLTPNHPLTLEEVIAISLRNNLDLRVKEREYAIQHEHATGERLKVLPSYIYSAEDSWRTKNTASYSVNAITGQISAGVDPTTGQPLSPYSIGTEQRVDRWDLTAAYSLIDFGLSYLRARQERNRAVSTHFQYERAKQNLILDVMKSYWKTMAAKKVIAITLNIQNTSEKLQANIEANVQSKFIPSSSGLKSELQLVGIRNRMLPITKAYQDGYAELAALMGILPGTPYELADAEINDPEFQLDAMETMEDLALANRPELYASDAEFHIFRDEVHAAVVEMLPNVSIFAGRNHDADKFLLYHSWATSGVRTAWNLLALPQKWVARRESKERLKLSRDSRLALSMGVVTQVHLAYFTYQDTLSNYKSAKQSSELNGRLLFIASKEREYGALDGVDMINFDADAIESYYLMLKSYGDSQIAIEILNNAMGLPLYKSHVSKTMR